jgi:hypothetical protein
MSKWEDSFKKKAFSGGENNCYCDGQYGLFLSNRQLSGVVAGLLFLFFVIFITGYFLGKRCVAAQFTQEASLDASIDRAKAKEVFEVVGINEALAVDGDVVTLVALEDASTVVQPVVEQEVQPEDIKQQDTKQYYAQLIGFGTEKAAQQFVQRVALKNIETTIKKHTSKTAKGRVSYWYQVVTAPYNNKDELSQVVAQLSREERLKDVSVRVY